MTRPNVDGLNRHDGDVDIFKDIKMPRGLCHISEVVAVINDAVDKAYAEREDSVVQDNNPDPNMTEVNDG